MESSRINDNGERVVGGTVRPDGTIRKERRVRAGYIPQDEQPVYMSMGATVRHLLLVPGQLPAYLLSVMLCVWSCAVQAEHPKMPWLRPFRR